LLTLAVLVRRQSNPPYLFQRVIDQHLLEVVAGFNAVLLVGHAQMPARDPRVICGDFRIWHFSDVPPAAVNVRFRRKSGPRKFGRNAVLLLFA
jgi:hypothetical protein